MADLLAQNIEKLKALLNEGDAKKRQKSSLGSRKTCSLTEPAAERAFLTDVISYCRQHPPEKVVQDLNRFLAILSHCNIPTPWTSSSDLLCHSMPNTGWFPNSDRSLKRPSGAQWVELEELFKDHLLISLANAHKSHHPVKPVLHHLSLFLSGETLLTEYTNTRIDALRPTFLAWIDQVARGEGQETTNDLKTIFETEYKLGMTGLFGRSTSPFQLLHSVCLSPLLEEFVVTEHRSGEEALNLYFGFATLSKMADDLHDRLTPFIDLFDASASISAARIAMEKVEGTPCTVGTAPDGAPHQDVRKAKALDGMSLASNHSTGTAFEPLWTDRMHLLVKPPWLWSHHFMTKLSTIVQHCREIIDKMVDALHQTSAGVATPKSTLSVNGSAYHILEAFSTMLHVSKSITIVNNRHLILDVGDDIRTLEESLLSLALTSEAVGSRFPEFLSQGHFDLVLSSVKFCVAALGLRLDETTPAKSSLSKNCRIIIDRFTQTRENLLRLQTDVRVRWLENYLLYDGSKNGNYSDVKSSQDDHVSPTFLMWYWTLRKHAMGVSSDTEPRLLAEALQRTLGIIMSRLAHSRVSQGRQSQLWRDAWFVMRCTVELLLFCEDFPVVLFSDQAQQPTATNAWYCQKLMAIAITLTAPFDRLYTATKKGYDSMLETFGRFKKRSLWHLLRPDLFLADLPTTGLIDAPLPSVTHFLLKLLSTSKPATPKRRLLTLLCLHVQRNAIASVLLRLLRTPGEDESVITGLVWILTNGEIAEDGLARVLADSFSK